MFSSDSVVIMMIGVLLGLTFIIGSIYFVNRLFGDNTQEILVKFILLVFTSLVAVWVVDKIIAFKINLLSDDQDNNLFELIKSLILMIFSYYFGTKNSKKD
jgi:hypothetical protein